MGDDGIGIRAIEQLHKESLPTCVELIDGGCGGLSLLHLFDDCQRLIIIDAADFGAPAGSIKILNDNELEQLPPPLAEQISHNFSLADILSAAKKLSTLPPLTLLLVQIESCRPQHRLSSECTAALPKVIQKIHAILW